MQEIERTIALLKNLSSDSWLRQTVETRIELFRTAQSEHYQRVADTTPQQIDRGRAGYGIDTGALKRSLEQNWGYVDGGGLETYSDLPYSTWQEALLRRKASTGAAQHTSFLLDDEAAMDLLETAIADGVQELW